MLQEDSEEGGGVRSCVYCRGPCNADAFAAPVWSCAWCRCHAHVACYQHLHPTEGSPAPEEAAAAGAAPDQAPTMAGRDEGLAAASAVGRHGQPNGLPAAEAGPSGREVQAPDLRRCRL